MTKEERDKRLRNGKRIIAINKQKALLDETDKKSIQFSRLDFLGVITEEEKQERLALELSREEAVSKIRQLEAEIE